MHETVFKQNPLHVLSRILNAGLKGDIFQTQELPLVISTVCKGFTGYLFAWDFIQENWDRLIEKLVVPVSLIPRITKKLI